MDTPERTILRIERKDRAALKRKLHHVDGSEATLSLVSELMRGVLSIHELPFVTPNFRLPLAPLSSMFFLRHLPRVRQLVAMII